MMRKNGKRIGWGQVGLASPLTILDTLVYKVKRSLPKSGPNLNAVHGTREAT